MRRLADVLVNDYQLSLTDWTLTSAKAISADGTTIVGSGINPCGETEGWIATLPPSVLYVDADATGPTHDGSNWCTAHLNLQDALGVAVAGDTVRVADGTYMPDGAYTPVAGVHVPGTGERLATFQLITGVTIEGGYAGCLAPDPDAREIDVYETILSGDLDDDDAPVACINDSPDCDSYGGLCVDGFCIIKQNDGENSYHVVTGSATDATAVLDGFTVTRGNADGGYPDNEGAGMYNHYGSPTLAQCTFIANVASNVGGGISNANGNPRLTRCTFRANLAEGGGGGGMYCDQGDPSLQHCVFADNSAEVGGGMSIRSSSPALADCAFTSNIAVQSGGGVFDWSGTNPTLTRCTFDGNRANFGSGVFAGNGSGLTMNNCVLRGNTAAWDGGGMVSDASSPALTQCLFTGNAADWGAGLSGRSSSATVINSTFTGNSADVDGGGVYNVDSSSPSLANCILWGNVDDADGDSGGPFADESAQVYTDSGTPVVTYSIVQGGWTGDGGTGNSSGDPLFVDADGPDNIAGTEDDDLRLLPGSPCIDAANDTVVPPDTTDLDDDGDTAERIPLDLGGMLRFLDDPDTVDTGVADPPDYTAVVDMGAYEYFPDCNGNGLPDECDLECSALGGSCDLPGCGESLDCQPNGFPDECDIADCVDELWCNDCNLNGVPDGCDDPIDEVPDECISPDTGGVNWSDPIWNQGADYPDNDPENPTGIPDQSVVLEDVDLVLDTSVEIDTLTIEGDASLTIPESGGDLSLADPGGLEVGGTLDVGASRTIDEADPPIGPV